MASSQPQPNGAPSTQTALTTQPLPSQPQQPQQQQIQQPQTQQQQQQQPQHPQHPQQPPSQPSATPRPRDARLIELLLTSQGVTAYEPRVPLLLLDFAYRHTSSVLSDALHLSADPYITQAGSGGPGSGSKSSASPAAAASSNNAASASASASAAAGAGAPGGDASVSANAVKVAIAARLGFQFRGGSSGGGIGKEYMLELARERNKVVLPKIVPNEWGVRLPSERFVLSGTSWGLKDMWDEDDDDDEKEGDLMEGIEGPEMEAEDIGGDGVEGGTIDDVFGDDGDGDADAEMADDG